MSDARRGLGQAGETLAARELARLGLRVIARNWRCAEGEIDLIALDGDCLVIVEVRTRRGRAYGTPEESITLAKRARLINLARLYVAETGWRGPWRIDLVAVELDRAGRLLRVTHLPSAIEG
ncbi:MAG TPA: YraN family protein [Caldilineae bacterium]|nr:YraN family protein [Caldilineae bacterium]